MIKLPKTDPIPAPDPATPTVAAPAPMNLAAESISRRTIEVWRVRTDSDCGTKDWLHWTADPKGRRNNPRDPDRTCSITNTKVTFESLLKCTFTIYHWSSNCRCNVGHYLLICWSVAVIKHGIGSTRRSVQELGRLRKAAMMARDEKEGEELLSLRSIEGDAWWHLCSDSLSLSFSVQIVSWFGS